MSVLVASLADFLVMESCASLRPEARSLKPSYSQQSNTCTHADSPIVAPVASL